MRLAATTLALLWLCALARALVLDPSSRARANAARTPAPPRLPPSLSGARGQRLELGASERTLAASPGVWLERRRYGSSEVALLSSAGVKELHPAGVCLRAAGLQIVSRGEEQTAAGCLGWLRVRGRDRSVQHFGYVFFDGQTVTCKFWKRAVLAVVQQLTGRPARWSTLQVMDPDAGRARQRLLALLEVTAAPAARPGGGSQ